MNRLGLLVAALGLTSMMGCAHVDEQRADYHAAKAQRAADHGHYGKAAREDRKANEAAHDAEHDPLP